MPSLPITPGRAARSLARRASPTQLQRAKSVLAKLDAVVDVEQDRREAEDLDRAHASWDDERWLTWAYEHYFGRPPDTDGLEYWKGRLATGLPRARAREMMTSSEESHFRSLDVHPLERFHRTRMAWAQSLPPARRIIDLGGTSQSSAEGSLLVLGYPYTFDELIIVDLPPEERHETFRAHYGPSTHSDKGTISYWYRSMTDLDDVPDASVDLLVSGQTFEHISPEDGREVLRQARRILTPHGHLALDTPNRAITEIQCTATGLEFINPDHKIEYRHEEMLTLFAEAGLAVERAQGLGYLPRVAATRTWDVEELLEHKYPVDAIEQSYTLAYLVTPA